MLKVTVTGLLMRVRARCPVTGSVLNDSVRASIVGAETTLEIDSPVTPGRVAKVVRNAEHRCFVMRALPQPVPITSRTAPNGVSLVLEEARQPDGRFDL
jgi:hypothetical protein